MTRTMASRRSTRTQSRAAASESTRAPRPRASGSRRDGLALLRDEHREVKRMFRDFEKAGDRAHATKRRLVDEMIKSLSQHAAVEEQVLYPWVRAEISDAAPTVLESLEEHHVVKWLLSELETCQPGDERFDAKVTVMAESVRRHVEEEEGELFPIVRASATRSALVELGDALQRAKRSAPTRPHPRGPDERPANVLSAPVTAALDRAREVGRQTVKVVRDEIEEGTDEVRRVTGRLARR